MAKSCSLRRIRPLLVTASGCRPCQRIPEETELIERNFARAQAIALMAVP
jgi:hypothetical protein